jgi:hypothetical protein
MPDDAVKPGLRAALRFNEISDGSPYQIRFACKGKSGGSFGFMQGDLAAGKPIVRATFRTAMQDAGIPAPAIDSLVLRLSVHLLGNPLSSAETQQVNNALAAGSALVDAMDGALLQDTYNGIDTCISHAHAAARDLQAAAQLYFACWINMTGPPSKTLVWLDGGNPQLARPTAPATAIVDGPAARAYLADTDYFVANPGNLPHLDTAVGNGMAAIASAAADAGV